MLLLSHIVRTTVSLRFPDRLTTRKHFSIKGPQNVLAMNIFSIHVIVLQNKNNNNLLSKKCPVTFNKQSRQLLYDIVPQIPMFEELGA